MSLKRPPNEVESKLHQAALSAPKKELTGKQAETLVPDLVQRQNALNFLLGVGLLKVLVVQGSEGKGKGKGKEVVFRAVGKEEADATKGLTGEENLVLSHIKSARNEGIWTKHLKSKTSLHQTIIDRCLKTLTQKRLIKRVQSVQHITRKIYMLEGLEPSSALTGGPWYTDNELDAEFIRGVGEGCWRIVWDVSFPKRKNAKANTSDKVLYPPSNAPAYPTAEQIRNALKKARLTDTELTVEHVEMVLNVLVLDGKIERLPAFSLSLWNDVDEGESDDEDGTTVKRKRKKRSGDSDTDESRSRKKKRKKGRDDESGSDSDERDRRKGKRKKGKGRSIDEEEEDGSGSDTEPAVRKKKKKKREKRSRSSSSSSSSPSPSLRGGTLGMIESLGAGVGGGTVYRALLEPPSASATSALASNSAHLFGGIFGGSMFGSGEGTTGGLMDAPCGACPVFDFCKVGGPANPRECVYYDEWMTLGLGEKEREKDGAEVKTEV